MKKLTLTIPMHPHVRHDVGGGREGATEEKIIPGMPVGTEIPHGISPRHPQHTGFTTSNLTPLFFLEQPFEGLKSLGNERMSYGLVLVNPRSGLLAKRVQSEIPRRTRVLGLCTP